LRGIDGIEQIDYAKKGLDVETVTRIVGLAGSVAAVLNTRHETAKARGWKEKPPSTEEFARAVAAEPNLLRRPVLILGKKVIVGFDRDAYAALR
jgi:arsenate reductase (glutaredoxin)